MPSPSYIVSLSEQAFFTIIASALEAFEISHAGDQDEDEDEDGGGPDANRDEEDEDGDDDAGDDEGEDGEDDGSEHEPLETYGNLWGYETRTKRDERVFHISLADVDTSAQRAGDSVTAKDEAFELKEDLVDWLRPELEYMGDFHTHPYGEIDRVHSARHVEKRKLYRFSRTDFARARACREERDDKYRVGLVATLFRGAKGMGRKSQYISENNASCIRFTYKDFTIWLQCYVFPADERARDVKVALLCPAIGFYPGRIDGQ